MSPKQIYELRGKLGVTQAQLATLFDVHPQTVSKWERGAKQPSDYQDALLERISARRHPKAFNVGKLLQVQGPAEILPTLL